MFPLKSSEFRLDDDQFSKLEGGEGKKNELLNLNLGQVEKKNLTGNKRSYESKHFEILKIY